MKTKIKTYENCPKGCESISYLFDNKEEKSCCKCGVIWDRFDNVVIKEPTNKETFK